MRNTTTNQTTPERTAELVAQIIPPGSDDAVRALVILVSTLAATADEELRLEIAAATAERAYTRTNAFGDAVLSLMRGDAPVVYYNESSH